MFAENPQPNNFEHQEVFGMKSQLENPDNAEIVEDKPDYIEKLTMTPLPLNKMNELVRQVASEYTEDDNSQQGFYKKAFIGNMQLTIQRLAETAKEGDNITFDDLSWSAEEANINMLNPETIVNDPTFIDEVNAISEITDKFAYYFDQHSELEYIGDNIDDYTVHSGVHTYQQKRVQSNSDRDLYGEEHGQNGRWIPEKRGDMTVWVAK